MHTFEKIIENHRFLCTRDNIEEGNRVFSEENMELGEGVISKYSPTGVIFVYYDGGDNKKYAICEQGEIFKIIEDLES